MIGNLLGHNKIDATSGYAHLAGDWTKAFSARVAHSNGGDILDRMPPKHGCPTDGAEDSLLGR